MPISSLTWLDADGGLPNASDVHVVRGAPSPSLLPRLQVTTGTSNTKMTAEEYLKAGNTDVTFEFQPLFRGAQMASDETKYQGLGVRVDVPTGAVEIPPELLADFTPFNFVIEITAKNKGTKVPGADRSVRVQAHGALRRVWLTPNPLTVRRPPPVLPPRLRDPQMRFVVRAEFDDKVIGDLTLENGTTWSPPSNVKQGRLLVGPTDPLGGIAITATLDARFGGPAPGKLWFATAIMRVEKGWHELAPAERPGIELLSKSGFPKKVTPETQMPNILLMSDGWGTPSDVKAFDDLTSQIMTTLRKSRLLRPFASLVDSMCFWGWFVPSPTRGFSVISEVRTFEDERGKLHAAPIPPAVPPLPTDKLTLQNLLYVVGLPMPDEKRSVEDLRKRWKETVRDETSKLYGDFVDSRVDKAVIEKWLELRTRTFVDCVDTEFHTGLGELPRVDSPLPLEGFFNFPDVFRGRENLTNAMAVLTTKKATLFGGLPVAELWSDPKNLPVLRFDNRGFVICFVPLPGARAHSGPPLMINTRADLSSFRVKPSIDPERAGHDLIAEEPLPVDVGVIVRTFAHELTHKFQLGDEYAEKSEKHPGSASKHINLMSDDELRGPSNAILVDRICWDWHRAEAAALIEGPIKVQDDFHYSIKVHPGHATQFSERDPVLLRLRSYSFSGPLLFGPSKTSVKFGSVESKVIKFELHIVKIVAVDELVVSPASDIASSELKTLLAALPEYGEGSVLFRPIRAPKANFDPKYPYMQLITPQIRNLIKEKPLWIKGCDSSNHDETQYPNLSGVPLINELLGCIKNSWRVVGLYEGGDRYTCGVYHPAGWCLLRNDDDNATELCAVCRYVLTDIIDPSLHNATDAVYREIYTAK